MKVQYEQPSLPTSPIQGELWHNTFDQSIYIFNGKVWNHVHHDMKNKVDKLFNAMPIDDALAMLEFYNALLAGLEWNEIVKYHYDKLQVALKMIQEDTK